MKNSLSLGLLVVAGLVGAQAQTYATFQVNGLATQVLAVNDLGTAVGSFACNEYSTGCGFERKLGGQITKMGSRGNMGANYITAALNSAGMSVGTVGTGGGSSAFFATYWHAKRFDDGYGIASTFGINAAGWYVGSTLDGGAFASYIPWGGPGWDPLDCPGPENARVGPCTPTGVNNSIQIVGYDNGENGGVPFQTSFIVTLDSTGHEISTALLNYPGAVATYAQGINDNQEVVGDWTDQNGVQHGFYWNPTAGFSDIDVTGDTAMGLVGINNSSVILGWWQDDNSPKLTHFVTIANGHPASINVPKCQHGTTAATAINNAGQVVGGYKTTSGEQAGFLYTPKN